MPPELFAPAESSRFEGALELPSLQAGPDEYSFPDPLAWHVEISNTGDALLVTGTVSGEAIGSCARCLDGFRFDLEGEIEGYYLLDESRSAPEDMDDDEFDVLPEDHVIDLEPLIKAALILEFPPRAPCATRSARAYAPSAVRISMKARANARLPKARTTVRQILSRCLRISRSTTDSLRPMALALSVGVLCSLLSVFASVVDLLRRPSSVRDRRRSQPALRSRYQRIAQANPVASRIPAAVSG